MPTPHPVSVPVEAGQHYWSRDSLGSRGNVSSPVVGGEGGLVRGAVSEDQSGQGIISRRTRPVPSSRAFSTRPCRMHQPQVPACSRHPSRPQRAQVISPRPSAQSVHQRYPSGPMPGISRSVLQLSQIPKTSIALTKRPEQISPSGQRRIQTTTGGLPGASRWLGRRTARSQRAQRSGSSVSGGVTRPAGRSELEPAAGYRCPARSRAGRPRRSCGLRC